MKCANCGQEINVIETRGETDVGYCMNCHGFTLEVHMTNYIKVLDSEDIDLMDIDY